MDEPKDPDFDGEKPIDAFFESKKKKLVEAYERLLNFRHEMLRSMHKIENGAHRSQIHVDSLIAGLVGRFHQLARNPEGNKDEMRLEASQGQAGADVFDIYVDQIVSELPLSLRDASSRQGGNSTGSGTASTPSSSSSTTGSGAASKPGSSSAAPSTTPKPDSPGGEPTGEGTSDGDPSGRPRPAPRRI